MTTLSDLLSAQASRQSNAPALLAPTQTDLSYIDLYQQVKSTSQTLRQFGINHQDRIAIVLPNGPEMAVACLSVSCAAISAPLNPGYTSAEFEFYLSDLKARAVIVAAEMDSPVRAVAQTLGIPLLEVSISNELAGLFHLTIPAQNHSAPVNCECIAKPRDTALLLHTSGTTTRPKLVPLTHLNLCASATNIQHMLQLTATDRCLNMMPLFHIHGLVATLLASIAAGASAVCTAGFAASQFVDWLTEFQPTWYSAVPTMHQAILAKIKQQELKQAHALRFIRSSSAALPPSVMHALEQTFCVPVIEAYGMTEASHQITSNPLPPMQRKPGSVGIAAGPEIAIMAEDRAVALATGQIGEVVVRGETVTSGYLDREDANAKAFADGWFRTGDQGYLDEDGYLFLTGRLKELINRGGEKVAPREVDEALLAHPAVAQAVTFATPHATLGEDVATAVVLAEDQHVDERELRHFLIGRIADHKIPSQIVIVNEIPKGPTGKLQRIGMAERLTVQLKPPIVSPTSPLEASLLDIYQEVLKQEEIGVAHNFFALGGDSLSGMQVITRIRQRLGVEIQPALLFISPTVGELAVAIILLKLKQSTPSEVEWIFSELLG